LVTDLITVLHISQSWYMLFSPVRVTSSRACVSLWPYSSEVWRVRRRHKGYTKIYLS
jgi:hypothetical protein